MNLYCREVTPHGRSGYKCKDTFGGTPQLYRSGKDGVKERKEIKPNRGPAPRYTGIGMPALGDRGIPARMIFIFLYISQYLALSEHEFRIGWFFLFFHLGLHLVAPQATCISFFLLQIELRGPPERILTQYHQNRRGG